MLERIQKIISAAGITSRRAAEQLIAEGRVRVNGQVVTELGTKADASRDHIKVDGKLINPRQPLTYIMLNKPAGYMTTLSDPEGRPTVQDLLKGVKFRVYPVGRLDYNTEGMLLLTNDGDFAHLITHPKHEFPKTYLAKVKGVLDDKQIETLEQGVFLEDGKTAPAKVRKVRKEEMNSWLEITIHEGRKRQVRRMFDHVGHSVIKLKRVRTGPLTLGDLAEGSYRHLGSDEVQMLRESALQTEDRIPVAAQPKAAEVRGERRQPDARKRREPVLIQDVSGGLRKNQLTRSTGRPGSGKSEAGREGRSARHSGFEHAKDRNARPFSNREGRGPARRGREDASAGGSLFRQEKSRRDARGFPKRTERGRSSAMPYEKSRSDAGGFPKRTERGRSSAMAYEKNRSDAGAFPKRTDAGRRPAANTRPGSPQREGFGRTAGTGSRFSRKGPGQTSGKPSGQPRMRPDRKHSGAGPARGKRTGYRRP